MLIELFGRNFRSFRDEFRLSMVAADIDRDNPRGIIEVELEGEDEPLRLLRCAAIYGPNASGKSSILWAAAALQYAIETSGSGASDKIIDAYEPFLLDEASSGGPAMLGLKAIIEHRVYEYSFEFNKNEFLTESLTEITADKPETLFERHGRNVEGPWKNEKQFELLATSFRPNALLLSLADNLAPALAKGLATGFRRLLHFSDSTSPHREISTESYVAEKLAIERRSFGSWLSEYLKDADVGIVGYGLRMAEGRPDPKNTHDAQKSRFALSLLHAATTEPVSIPFSLESLGTQRFVELAPYIYDLTHDEEKWAGFIDEIGASMHPDLLRAMIRHFNCEVPQEQVRGQLIFATHETSLIDAEAKDAILRRDQVYLTEKNAEGESSLYSIADFKERNNLNLRRRYLQGRYGALPSLGSFGD